MKKYNSYFNNIKTFIKNQVHGKKSVGAILYWIFQTFQPIKHDKTRIRLRNLAYKVIRHFPIAGRNLLKLFSIPQFKEDFSDWLTKSASCHTKEPVIMKIDSSKLGFKYGNCIPELRKLFDYVKRYYLKTHEIYVLLVSIGSKDYVVDFIIQSKDKNGGWNAIAQDLLSGFLANLGTELSGEFLKHGQIALDGAWGNGSMMQWLSDTGFEKVAIKSGGKDNILYKGVFTMSLNDLKHLLIKFDKFKSFDPSHHFGNVEYCEELVTLCNSELQIHVVLLKFTGKDIFDNDRYLMLLSLPKDRWYHFQILKAYKGRWSVETLFRTNKQYFDIEKYSFHTKNISDESSSIDVPKAVDRIELHLSLRFIGYMIISWYRVDCTRPSKTGLKKVIERWKRFFDVSSGKEYQKLFFG